MAKKSKKKVSRKPARRRGRGRVGAFGGGIPMEQAGLALVGGLGGRLITNITKNVSIVQKKPMFRVAAKGLLAYWLLTQKSQTMTALAGGLLGETALDAAGQFAPNVFGLAKVDGIGARIIDLDGVSGTNDDYGVAGMNEDLAVAGAY